MTVKVIISGAVLCAMTAAGGVGLSFLSSATSHTPEPRTVFASAPTQALSDPVVPVEVAEEEAEPSLLPDDIQITFVAARAPHEVAESLAPLTSRHPLVRSGEIRPAVVVTAGTTHRPIAQQRSQAQPVRATIQRNTEPTLNTDQEWMTGVYR